MASNPTLVSCPADTITKVASGIIGGTITKISTRPAKYLQTFRVKDDPAPTDLSDFGIMFYENDSESIVSDDVIDVYVIAVRNAGIVRVSI